jgi:hypothetical protein
VGVIVAKREELLVTLLQRLEPGQSFIDCNLSHRSTLTAASCRPTTTMASSSKRCQARDLKSWPTFVVLISEGAIGAIADDHANGRCVRRSSEFCARPFGYAALCPSCRSISVPPVEEQTSGCEPDRMERSRKFSTY